jgi:hypothetical protein
MLIQGIPPREICRTLSMTPEELQQRRRAMVETIAPNAGAASLTARTRAPLDYRRLRRRYLGSG